MTDVIVALRIEVKVEGNQKKPNLVGLFCRKRTIRYVWADDHGQFDELGWATFEFYGRSLFNLRAEVARHAEEEISFGITLCVRPGFYGRLTPLVIDLPRSEEPMDIVVLTTWSPANEELRYPDVDSPEAHVSWTSDSSFATHLFRYQKSPSLDTTA